ncbi:hypothetical protein TSUD_96770 [Trifolium subterraneum]|nr:hypothetical protein TSUD_96770 [Trifolium subterraneum]
MQGDGVISFASCHAIFLEHIAKECKRLCTAEDLVNNIDNLFADESSRGKDTEGILQQVYLYPGGRHAIDYVASCEDRISSKSRMYITLVRPSVAGVGKWWSENAARAWTRLSGDDAWGSRGEKETARASDYGGGKTTVVLTRGLRGGNGNKDGLFSVLLRDYKSDAAASCMNRLAKLRWVAQLRSKFDLAVKDLKCFLQSQGLILLEGTCEQSARWIGNHGFSIGIDDVQPKSHLIGEKDKIIKGGYKECDGYIEAFNKRQLQSAPGCDAAQTLESKIFGNLNGLRDKIAEVCMRTLHWRNSPLIMSQCGSKGSPINICQMVACVGQQSVGGCRAANGFIDRSLPHFHKKAQTPDDKGFVRDSFFDGLSATEFFFHTMGGREGLVDTAIRISVMVPFKERLYHELRWGHALYEVVGDNDKDEGGPPQKRCVTVGCVVHEQQLHCKVFRTMTCKQKVKTADTGYMSRRLMKALEDLFLHYDYTVRDTNGGIVQFCYGDDGMDPAGMEGKNGKPLNFDRLFLKSKAICPSDGDDVILSSSDMHKILHEKLSEVGMYKLEEKDASGNDIMPEAGFSADFIKSLESFVEENTKLTETIAEDDPKHLKKLNNFIPRISGISRRQLEVFLVLA